MKALRNVDEKNVLFFDIETARTEKVLKIDTPTFESWKYTKKKSEANITNLDVINSYQKEASLYPEYSRVASVVLGVVRNGKILTATYDDKDETVLLKRMNNHINKLLSDNPRVLLCGWNIKNFDMPFLFKRSLINKIEPNLLVDTGGDKPWEITAIDLMELWKSGFKGTSMLAAATAFGLPSPKNDIDGSQVSEVFWSEGVGRISSYCVRDVVTTVNLFRKMNLQEPLEPEVAFDDVTPNKVKTQEITSEKLPLMTALFAQGDYTASRKKELVGKLSEMSDSDKAKAKVIVSAMISNAKGKVTKITKKDFKEL